MEKKLPSIKILGTSITTAAKSEILDFIITGLKEGGKKFYIVTPNPEMLVYAATSSVYQGILNKAQVALPDGIGVLAAGNILKKGVKERITGVDLMEDIIAKCAKEGLSIGLLGGTNGVAEKTAECLREKYPDLRVNFASDEWPSHDGVLSSLSPRPKSSFATAGARRGSPSAHHPLLNRKSHPTSQDQVITDVTQISDSNPIDILFVAFGVPKQEEWIANNLDKIPVTAAMGVGGAFDFISGKVRRAPKFVRSAGMEWAFRLAIQPWRIKRQMALPKFATKVLRERFSSNQHVSK